MKLEEDFKAMLVSYIISIIDKVKTLKYLPTQKHSTKPPNPNNVVPSNRRAPPLVGGSLRLDTYPNPA